MAIADKAWVQSLLKKAFKKVTTYSTDEVKIGTWVDGKPIYRKVYDVNISGSGSKNYALNLDINNLIDLKLICALTDNNNFAFIIQNSNTSGTHCGYNGTSVYWYDTRSNLIVKSIIVEYTKTTD